MSEPNLSDVVEQVAALTREVADLRRELAETRADLRKLNPPPDGWLASLNWYAADGSGRWVCVDTLAGAYSYGKGADVCRGAATPYDAAKASDALAVPKSP